METAVVDNFRIKGTLTAEKLLEYLPIMIFTNLSTLLLLSVNSIVVGNFISSEALASVNILLPAINFVGVISSIVASGSALCLSKSIGKNETHNLDHFKHAMLFLIITASVFVAVVQIPFFTILIRSYHLSEEMHKLTWQYAVGMMVAMPIGIISTVGSYQLQVIGKMKVLMWLTVIEGVTNLALDLLFIVPLKMGIAGAGFGTAGANLVRCSITVIYLAKKTDIYKFNGAKIRSSDIKNILESGIPEATQQAMAAFQDYFLMIVILSMFGEGGGVIKGACVFAANIASMFILGVQSSMRSLLGIKCGSHDKAGLNLLMIQGLKIVFGLTLIITLFVELFPSLMYSIQGVSSIPKGGIASLRIRATSFVFIGVCTIFRLYLSTRGDTKVATVTVIAGNALLPVLAYALSKFLSAPWIWFSYTVTNFLIAVFSFLRYRHWVKTDVKKAMEDTRTLYLSVDPKDAVEASREIRNYASENGFDEGIAWRVALCVEEMVAYAINSQNKKEVLIQLMVHFREHGAVFTMMDDGRCIALDKNVNTKTMMVDNYTLLKKLCKTCEYQYILGMNFTVFTF
ncbi:MAG: polysaccharide biosynthesis C-terminal domain-containing protein [Spirochaetales bacterium]|nr:polysaccharide biosynthesis C-terminal domain-containing protein [Spirochaetales bacterium]